MEYAHASVNGDNMVEINNGVAMEDDRLSSLPEPIIVDILSLLPIHSAVSTGILSHRWRDLWTQITDLKIDSRDFINHKSDSFVLIDHILRQLTSIEIRRFKLHVRDPADEDIHYRSSYWEAFCSHIKHWISLICDRKVKELEVIADNYLGHDMLLPHCLFQCEYLVVLKLGQGFDFRLPDKINLSNLKKLHVNLGDSHRELMGKLFRSCPLLEELLLIGTFSEDKHFIDISASNLKWLSIQVWLLNSKRIKVVIDAPNLQVFNVYDFVWVKFWFIKEPSMFLEMGIYSNVPVCEKSTALELFQAISHVRSLYLDFALINALNYLDDPKLPILRNLTNLALPINYPKYWKALHVLLHCSPNVEFLSIRMVPGLRDEEIIHVPLEPAPACLATRVKRMEIVLWGTEQNEMELIKYLLSNANVLEHLVVKLNGESERREVQLCKELKFYEGLCKIPRSSSLCCVELRGIDQSPYSFI